MAEGRKWIKFNRNQVGFYRVNYAPEEWKTLSEALSANLSAFSVADRGHLLNDAFSLAEATQLEYSVALDLTAYLVNETRNVPWNVAAGKLKKIRNLMMTTPNLPKFTVREITGCHVLP